MSPDDKQEIRRFCTQFLVSEHSSYAAFIQKKMVKVYVNIGRLDWPQFFPDFYHNIIQVNCINMCFFFVLNISDFYSYLLTLPSPPVVLR